MAVRTERDNAASAVEGFTAEPNRTFFLRICNHKILLAIMSMCHIVHVMRLMNGG